MSQPMCHWIYFESLTLTRIIVRNRSPLIKMTKIHTKKFYTNKENFFLQITKAQITGIQEYRNTNYRNTKTQITTIVIYKLQKYINTNYINKNYRNIEISITETINYKLQKY